MFSKPRGEPTHQSDERAIEPTPRPVRSGETRPASLGPSISITGNLTGNEDLIIEGSVEGEIMVRDHKITISETGRVKADIYGRSICVEGQVDGNLLGDEQVIIRRSGTVRGNVTAPRVNLENGAKFKGSIDMQPASAASDPARARSAGSAVNADAPAAGSRAVKPAAATVAAATRAT